MIRKLLALCLIFVFMLCANACAGYSINPSGSNEQAISLQDKSADGNVPESGISDNDFIDEISPVRLLSPTRISLTGPDKVPLTIDFLFASVKYCNISVDTGRLETETGQQSKSIKVYADNMTEPLYALPKLNSGAASESVIDEIIIEAYNMTGAEIGNVKILVNLDAENGLCNLIEVRTANQGEGENPAQNNILEGTDKRPVNEAPPRGKLQGIGALNYKSASRGGESDPVFGRCEAVGSSVTLVKM